MQDEAGEGGCIIHERSAVVESSETFQQKFPSRGLQKARDVDGAPIPQRAFRSVLPQVLPAASADLTERLLLHRCRL